MIRYEIYDPRRQFDLTNLFLNEVGLRRTIGINSSGLSRDLPFGSSTYNFAIAATDENGSGVTSYIPVSIEVTDTNNRGPIPTVRLHSNQ